MSLTRAVGALVKLEGVGHFPLIEAPERVMEVFAGRVWPMAR